MIYPAKLTEVGRDRSERRLQCHDGPTDRGCPAGPWVRKRRPYPGLSGEGVHCMSCWVQQS
jgi:hypothetical protein